MNSRGFSRDKFGMLLRVKQQARTFSGSPSNGKQVSSSITTTRLARYTKPAVLLSSEKPSNHTPSIYYIMTILFVELPLLHRKSLDTSQGNYWPHQYRKEQLQRHTAPAPASASHHRRPQGASEYYLLATYYV